jgi:hypothetical protein
MDNLSPPLLVDSKTVVRLLKVFEEWVKSSTTASPQRVLGPRTEDGEWDVERACCFASLASRGVNSKRGLVVIERLADLGDDILRKEAALPFLVSAGLIREEDAIDILLNLLSGYSGTGIRLAADAVRRTTAGPLLSNKGRRELWLAVGRVFLERRPVSLWSMLSLAEFGYGKHPDRIPKAADQLFSHALLTIVRETDPRFEFDLAYDADTARSWGATIVQHMINSGRATEDLPDEWRRAADVDLLPDVRRGFENAGPE